MNEIPCHRCVDIERRDPREARRAVKFSVGGLGEAAVPCSRDGDESGSLGCRRRVVNDALGCSR